MSIAALCARPLARPSAHLILILVLFRASAQVTDPLPQPWMGVVGAVCNATNVTAAVSGCNLRGKAPAPGPGGLVPDGPYDNVTVAVSRRRALTPKP